MAQYEITTRKENNLYYATIEDYNTGEVVTKLSKEKQSAIKLAIERLMELERLRELKKDYQIGDKVEVVDNGYSYTTYADWFKEQKIDPEIAARYAYDEAPVKNTEYYIIAKGAHKYSGDGEIYLISVAKPKDTFGKIFLIGKEGIKKVN